MAAAQNILRMILREENERVFSIERKIVSVLLYCWPKLVIIDKEANDIQTDKF